MAGVQSIYGRKQHGLVNMDRKVSQEETIAQLQRSQVVRDIEKVFQTMVDANCQLGFKAPQSMFGALQSRQFRSLYIHLDEVYPGELLCLYQVINGNRHYARIGCARSVVASQPRRRAI